MDAAEQTVELTPAEELFDQVVRSQRLKGRRTYGRGLDWRDGDGEAAKYDWNRMALEEAVDLAQYLVAENFRLQREASAQPSSFNEYQQQALVTVPPNEPLTKALAVRGLGLAGEAGEVVEHLKKFLGHGHELDVLKVEKELGDVLWYVATLAAALDIPLDRIARKNIEKLRERYPAGFSHEASRDRSK